MVYANQTQAAQEPPPYIDLEQAQQIFQKAAEVLPEGNNILISLARAIDYFALALEKNQLNRTEQAFANVTRQITEQAQLLCKANEEIYSTYGESVQNTSPPVTPPIACGNTNKNTGYAFSNRETNTPKIKGY